MTTLPDDECFDEAPAVITPDDPDWQRNAVWHLRHIHRLENQQRATILAFNQEIERLTDKRDETAAMFERRIEWHREPLRQLHRALLAADPKWKTITLPYGELASRTPKTPTVRTPDRAAFIEWARTNAPQLLELTAHPDREALKAAVGDILQPVGTPVPGEPVELVTATGEKVPGLTLALDDTTFSIRTAEL